MQDSNLSIWGKISCSKLFRKRDTTLKLVSGSYNGPTATHWVGSGYYSC